MVGWGHTLVAEMNACLAAAQAGPPQPLTDSAKLAALCECADFYGWEARHARTPDEARPEKGFTHAQRTASDNASI